MQARVFLRELQVLQLVEEPLFVFSLTTGNEFADFNFGLLTSLIEILEVLRNPR